MIISDLSYLNEVSEENISGGRGRKKYDFKFAKKIDVEIDVDVYSDVDADGAFNELSFDLQAVGYYGSGTEIVVNQVAVDDYGYYVSLTNGTVTSFAE